MQPSRQCTPPVLLAYAGGRNGAGTGPWSAARRLTTGEAPPRRYYVKDHLGSVRAVVDAMGAVVEARDYYPFGLRMPGRSMTAGTPAREDFTGHERDAETGLHYAGARYYMSALGRWMSTEPMLNEELPAKLLKDGKGQLLVTSPYNYSLNNPTTLRDPDGRCPICIGIWAAVEVGLAAYDAYDVYATTTDPNATNLDKAASIGGALLGTFLPGGGLSASDNVARAATKTLSRLNIDRAAVNVVEGSSDKAAVVIGQGMERVEGLADEIGGETFSASQAALDEWADVLEEAGGERLSDEVVQQTKLFKENQEWIHKMKEQGRTIIDIGSQPGKGRSTFYEMEKEVINGGR